MRVVMTALGLLALLGVPGAVGYTIGARRPTDGTARRLREHARLLAKASRASRRGRYGEANIYTEAAERLWREPPALNE